MSASSERDPAIRGVLRRLVHVVWALGLGSIVLLPNLPRERFGELPGVVAGRLRPISFVQSWRMYAPDPQRSQTYMNLVAHYPGGREVELEETIQEKNGWTVTWAGNKTRVDIWRHYANFHGTGRNDNRTWYLRAVCVREARKGEVPTRISMTQVRRRFATPERVGEGKPDLGRRRRLKNVNHWMPCKTKIVMKMIEADRERRGESPRGAS